MKGVPNEKTKHICRLVSGQKKSKGGRPRFTARGGRNGFVVRKSRGQSMQAWPAGPYVPNRFRQNPQQQLSHFVGILPHLMPSIQPNIAASRTNHGAYETPPRMKRSQQPGKQPVNWPMGKEKDSWQDSDDQRKLKNKQRLDTGQTLKSTRKNYVMGQSVPEDVGM